MYYEDPNTGGDNFDFSEKTVRHGFIRKVYLILCGQLTITFGFVALFTVSDDVKHFARNNLWLFWVALVTTIVCILALACCANLRRKFPHNFIFLGLFTFCEGFLLGFASADFTKEEILMAVGITLVVVLSLTLFAFQTKIDFTMCGGFLFASLVVLILFGILVGIFRNKKRSLYRCIRFDEVCRSYAREKTAYILYSNPGPLAYQASDLPSEIFSIVYSAGGALLFCFYLVYDTQIMMGEGHRYAISPEEYVFAALNLYLDILHLFLDILSLVVSFRN